MKSAGIVACVFGLLLPTLSLAQTAAPAALLGRWALDTSRLPAPPSARPQRVTFDFHDEGGGHWKTQVDKVDASGEASHAKAIVTLDGKPATITGSDEADTVALKLPARNVLVMALAKAGVPASTRIYTVAGDGRSMVETSVYFADDGTPIMHSYDFTRVD